MDRLTQLQQAVDKLLQVYFTSIGALQRDAPLMEPDGRIPVTGINPLKRMDPGTNKYKLARHQIACNDKCQRCQGTWKRY